MKYSPSRWLPFEEGIRVIQEEMEDLTAMLQEASSATLDYIAHIFDDFVELHGDRRYGDDQSLVGGPAMLGDYSVMVIGHQKGRTTKERQERNFGSSNPEAYRKAQRLLEMAERLGMPVISLIDTPAAQCLFDAEARGISEAIAATQLLMGGLRVPIVVVVTGEGGSGGAIAIGVGDVVMMLEHAIYSVIPPEGFAAILYKNAAPEQVQQAAALLRRQGPAAVALKAVRQVPGYGQVGGSAGVAPAEPQAHRPSRSFSLGLSPSIFGFFGAQSYAAKATSPKMIAEPIAVMIQRMGAHLLYPKRHPSPPAGSPSAQRLVTFT